jgi:cytochrome c-type biogenesis protein CcmH
MSWVVAILLALAAFAAIAGLFRQPRAAWTILFATLGFGLAGYATQASPGIASAPKQSVRAQSDEGGQFVALRKELVGESRRSRSPYILMADAWVREGRYEGAVTILRGVTRASPGDGDAWLAFGNVLFLHAAKAD